MSDQLTTAAFHRTERAGSPLLVTVFAIALLVAAFALTALQPEQASLLKTYLLALLAVVGIFALFGYAIGLFQIAGKAVKSDVTRVVCDTGPEGLLVTDAGGKFLYANDTYLRLANARSVADLRGVERLFSGSPEVSEAVYRLAQAARDGKRALEEVRLSPPLDGTVGGVGWYRVRVRPLPQLPGAKRASLWGISDVTRERERHENVFQELQHAIDFLDHAPAGFFSCSPDGDVSYMNATLATWLDYDLAQVGSGGLKLTDFLAGGGAALIGSVVGAPGEVRTEQFDLDMKRRGGQSLPVRLLHRVAFGQDGLAGPSRTLVISRAPGEEPAEDLRAAEVRFARVFNSTPVAIAITDATGAISQSNASFAKMIPASLKVEGGRRSIFAAIAEDDRAALQRAIRDAAAMKSDIPPVDVGIVGDGAKSARLFVSGSEQEGGGATIYALDTTEQRALKESFAQSQKMQAVGQLAGGIAHDFNNVLTAIIGFSDLLLANHRPTDPSFQDIMQIKQNANRAAALTRQLLAFSRRQTLRPEVLQLGDVMSDLQMLMRRLVGEKIELDLRHGRDLWLVKADLNQFEQVIINLVVNAKDAMPSGGRIVLRTRNVPAAECAAFQEDVLLPGDYVAIEVQDNGTGIPEDIREKIFEPFFTTKEVGKGTGLGLSMVYGIVKQTEGYVFCQSEVGKGTTFVILLPRHVATEVEEPVKKEVAKVAVTDSTGHGTILLVEDEDAVRAFSARALISKGYTVLEASSGLEALEVAEANVGTIDLVVSDVVMPEMDGPTMFGELRKRGIKCKVIFVSGYAEDAFAKNLPEGEDFGFLPKPFALKQLIEAVKTATG
ncbi:Protein histidine kinase / Response regulator [Beijerinckiaceae bacterium RH AL1]|nr:ATP-binding protein [Beijerinckiaceae bacterium]VVB43230.1 Protein histidine kinase / Response regulator [Beijerinckiaceae bacterium RH AL8]VVB43245.1 Protein histidine kinase / Response regulator [Beijerinckiaceae bacterium RH CH11]VVC53736.1 Protein histidine kinase / Response regulator [Beijerinckiaceae bacterium RH AL1]